MAAARAAGAPYLPDDQQRPRSGQRGAQHEPPIHRARRARVVPTGRVLVHNHVRHEPDTPVGVNGFRAWTQPPGDEIPVLECACGWAPLAGVHYRVELDRARERNRAAKQ